MNPEMPMLVVYEGELQGQRWVLDKDLVTIGRDVTCEISLPERQISRYHARIERRGGEYLLHDLGSKNGTHVNGQEVRGQPYRLRDGDELQIALAVRIGFVGADATLPLGETIERGLRLDQAAHEVYVRGRKIDPPLSVAQYRLLETLVEAEGAICTRDQVVQAVWPDTSGEGVSEQAIDALVRRLRDRLAEMDPNHQYILTVRGHGFRLENL